MSVAIAARRTPVLRFRHLVKGRKASSRIVRAPVRRVGELTTLPSSESKFGISYIWICSVCASGRRYSRCLTHSIAALCGTCLHVCWRCRRMRMVSPTTSGQMRPCCARYASTRKTVCVSRSRAQSGLQGVGTLLVHAAPKVEVGSVAGDVVEALGHLLADLGDLAGQCLIIAATSRAQLGKRLAPPFLSQS